MGAEFNEVPRFAPEQWRWRDLVFFGGNEPGHIGIVIEPRHAGDMLFGAEVHCTTHGPMKRRDVMSRFECVGFDGEGCPAIFTDEELHDISEGGTVLWDRNETVEGWQAHKDFKTGNLIVKVIPRGYERPSAGSPR